MGNTDTLEKNTESTDYADIKEIANRVYQIKKREYVKIAVSVSVLLAFIAAFFIIHYWIIPSVRYAKAERLCEKGNIKEAAAIYSTIRDYKDSQQKMHDTAFTAAEKYVENNDLINAALMFLSAGECIRAEKTFDFNRMVMGYSHISAGISQTGEVYYSTDRINDDTERGLQDIIEMAKFLPKASGINGLDTMGRVVSHYIDSSIGITISTKLKNQLYSMEKIADIITDTNSVDNYQYVIVLNADGSLSIISENKNLFAEADTLKDIDTITAGVNKIFAVDTKGQLYVLYANGAKYDISDFTSVKKVIETGKCLIGLTQDGKIITSYLETEQKYNFNFDLPKQVKDIAANGEIFVMLMEDGSVKAADIPNWIIKKDKKRKKYIDNVIGKIQKWKNVARIRFSNDGIFGITHTGNVYFSSCDISFNMSKNRYTFNPNKNVAKAVKKWTGVVDVIDCNSHSIAIKDNGSVYCVGSGNISGAPCTNLNDWALWENPEAEISKTEEPSESQISE